jgi:large subunit ribosomal protein L25
MPEVKIVAETGRVTGSRSAGRLRAQGKVPAVIYGHGMDPISVAVEGRALRSALNTEAGTNALLTLEVDGTSHLTMARDLQRHPVRNTVVHVDFQIVRRDEVMAVEVPLTLVGDAEAVRRGDGMVDQQLHTLSVSATPDRIPNSIEVDISALAVGDTIRVSDLPLPEGVSADLDPETAVVVGQAPQAGAEGAATQVEAGEGADAAAPDAAAARAEAGASGDLEEG